MRAVLRTPSSTCTTSSRCWRTCFELPTSADIAVRMTNLRTLDGKRPIFVDDMRSVFVFPYHRITFIEIPPTSLVGTSVEDSSPSRPRYRPPSARRRMARRVTMTMASSRSTRTSSGASARSNASPGW